MSTQNDQKPTALFIDVANCRQVNFDQLLDLARQQGPLTLMRAYGNFANSRYLGKAAHKLFLMGVRLIHCPAWPNGSGQLKCTADETLMNDVRSCLEARENASQFIICSGDAHFIPTMLAIKKQGKRVIVMAEPQSVSEWVRATADTFVPLSSTPAIPDRVFKALVEAARALQKTQQRSGVPAGTVKVKMGQFLGEQFDEKQYCDRSGRSFKRFTEFLKAAQAEGWIRLIPQGSNFLVTTKADRAKAA